jgi:preprotein translocase subunit SecY
VGNKVYGGQSSHLPLKLNMAGVIPPIFASSIILLPANSRELVQHGRSMRWLKDIAAMTDARTADLCDVLCGAIIFFCFFYTALVFNSRETADNLKKSGAFVPGIRPGEQTARYIDKILGRLTLAGAVYITFVCLAARVLDFQVQRAVLFRWYLVVDHCGGDHGLHGPGSELHDVPAIRVTAEEGQLQGLGRSTQQYF